MISNVRFFTIQEQLDPFSIVADELSILADRLRSMVVAEVLTVISIVSFFTGMYIAMASPEYVI